MGIDAIIGLIGAVVMLGFALTILVVAWVVPVAAIFGIIAIFHKDTTHDQ